MQSRFFHPPQGPEEARPDLSQRARPRGVFWWILPAVAIACLAVGCSETLIKISPIPGDADAADPPPEDVVPEADDPVEEAGPNLPTNICEEVCGRLWICSGDMITVNFCGAMCARFTPEARTCVIETPDCRDLIYGACETDDHTVRHQCHEVCDFMAWRCGFDTICHFYCPLYVSWPRDCADVARGRDDCGNAAQCLAGHDYGPTCHDACEMAIDDCGLDLDPDNCRSNCEDLATDSMSRACIDVAVYAGDCDALSSCGGLWP